MTTQNTNKFYDQVRGRNRWTWLKDLNIGDSELIREGRDEVYVTAQRFGIVVSVNKQPDGDLKVTRIA